jgi:fructose-specific phosphotransferase system IIA component
MKKSLFETLPINNSTLSLIDSQTAAYIRDSQTEMDLSHSGVLPFMNLFTLLDEHTVIPALEADSKEQVINALVDSLSEKIDPDALKTIREDVFERESIMSTGVGKGLAIPHCKTKAVEENYAAFARLKEPLDYKSIDGQPVSIVFLLVGPDSRQSHHIKLLSRISRLMNSGSFREKIISSTSTSVILDAFKEEEEKYFLN